MCLSVGRLGDISGALGGNTRAIAGFGDASGDVLYNVTNPGGSILVADVTGARTLSIKPFLPDGIPSIIGRSLRLYSAAGVPLRVGVIGTVVGQTDSAPCTLADRCIYK